MPKRTRKSVTGRKERKARQDRRDAETEKQAQERRAMNAQYQRMRRSAETEEQKEERRRINALQSRLRRRRPCQRQQNAARLELLEETTPVRLAERHFVGQVEGFNGVLKVEPETLAVYTSQVNVVVKEEPYSVSHGTTRNSVQSENGPLHALNVQPEAFAVSTSQVCIVVKEEPLDVLCENIMGTTQPTEVTSVEPAQRLFCLECNKSFHAAGDLRLHMKTHHQDSRGKQHKCSYCFYRTGDGYKLRTHEKIHVELPYKCSLCEKAFAKLSGLKIHFTVHTRNEESYDSVYFNTKIRGKMYDCSICKRAFAHRCNLKTHKRIHTGEKPYECPVCKKVFAYHHSLAAHERTHSGEKPFECSFCKKAFASSSNLPAHMRIHMNEKKNSKEDKQKL
uniref:C2H2-type domain-containing protein n=1 Tax=Eptatretus burgeri TaxID=7764 RepID=A0A8C4X1A5_EPTBU